MLERALGGPGIASRPTSPLAKALAVPVVIALVLAGVWFTGAVVSDDMKVAMAATTVWFGIVGLGGLLVVRSRRDLLLPVLGTFAVTATAIGGWLAYESLVDDKVNEDVAVGVPASQAGSGGSAAAPAEEPAAPEGGGAAPAGNVQVASGSFSALAHPASGTAAVVELDGGGRVLTLTDFETDPGPDLRVYLATDESAGDFKDLGGLKGNVGNQQYELADDIDVSRYDTVLIWCRAFTVGFGQATLAPS
ncbi:MAG TPA: DM13 domain-containing protein [Thermoleophilaceae bacterium]|nr:DM13 domain-containing protein [Thermoleophilaceae bacterium]